jgi:heme oxygenase
LDVGSIPARASIATDIAPSRRVKTGHRHGLLREATRELHTALEAAAAEQGFFASLPGYRCFLQRSVSYHAALVAGADTGGAAALLADWPERRKISLLLADCAALGIAPAAPAPGWITAGPSSPAELLGTLYVSEGATLGGAMLARIVARLGIGPDSGAAFLDAYGPHRGRRWRAFLAVLEAAPLGAEGEARLVRAAEAAFEAYRRVVIEGRP